MLVFNLKKEWFDKIKNGEKTHEYRVKNNYWFKRLFPICHKLEYKDYSSKEQIQCIFACGYPKRTDIAKRLKAEIKSITIRNGLDTDLKIDKEVYDIEFELIKNFKRGEMEPELKPRADVKEHVEHSFELNKNKFKTEEINVTECPEYYQSYCDECLSLAEDDNCIFKQLKRQQYYLEKIRAYELNSLDVDWDEYEKHACDTEYSPIIDYVELALGEKEYE